MGRGQRPFLDYFQAHWGYHSFLADEERSGDPQEMDVSPGVLRHLSFHQPVQEDAAIQYGVRRLAGELGGMKEVPMWACKNNRTNAAEILLTANAQSYAKLETATNTKGCRDTNCTPCFHPEWAPSEFHPYGEPSAGCIDGPREAPRPNSGQVHSTLDEALIIAVQNSHKDIVKLLLDHGASVAARDTAPGYSSVLSLAAQEGFHDIISLLLDHDDMDLDVADSFERR